MKPWAYHKTLSPCKTHISVFEFWYPKVRLILWSHYAYLRQRENNSQSLHFRIRSAQFTLNGIALDRPLFMIKAHSDRLPSQRSSEVTWIADSFFLIRKELRRGLGMALSVFFSSRHIDWFAAWTNFKLLWPEFKFWSNFSSSDLKQLCLKLCSYDNLCLARVWPCNSIHSSVRTKLLQKGYQARSMRLDKRNAMASELCTHSKTIQALRKFRSSNSIDKFIRNELDAVQPESAGLVQVL